MANIEKPPALATLTAIENIGHSNNPINSENGTPAQAEIKIPDHLDLRLAELRDVLIGEIFLIFAIGLQAASGLRNGDDLEALADLRRLWI